MIWFGIAIYLLVGGCFGRVLHNRGKCLPNVPYRKTAAVLAAMLWPLVFLTIWFDEWLDR